MNIIISNSANQPIYEQIYSQIKNQIITEKLSSGDLLPSIRTLAKDLRISVITTKRAYDELEKEGYIYTVSAKGSYVAEKTIEQIKEEHLKQIEEHFEKIIQLAKPCNLSDEDIITMLKTLLREEDI